MLVLSVQGDFALEIDLRRIVNLEEDSVGILVVND
jgi:hypothetical protein